MANSTILSAGRFSSQMLTYLGTQRTVKSVTGSPENTFKYASGAPVFVDPASLSQSALGFGETGSYSPSVYNSTKCYFLSRGASVLYADTMTGLVIDMAQVLGVSVQTLLEKSTIGPTIMFSDDAYRAMNLLRDPGNQVGRVTTLSNKYSLQASQIRS